MNDLAPRTAVNQAPHGGTDYPFAADGDLTGVVLDAYLSYEDDACARELPFSLQLTVETVDPVNLIVTVLDADANSVLSREAGDAIQTTWGNRLVLDWPLPLYRAVFRLVVHVPSLTVGEYTGVLDPRTCNRVPARVRSITANAVTMTGRVVLQAGNNAALAGRQTARVDGGRRVDVVAFDGVPGAGAGRLDGCEEAAPVIRKINGIGPGCGGSFRIEADPCFRVQLPLDVTAAGDVLTAEYAADALTTEEAQAAVLLTSDCHPCRDCDYYVRVYKGLKRVWDRWKDTAGAAEAVRNTLTANIDRWEAARTFREANAARLVMMSDKNCSVFIGGTVCNMTATIQTVSMVINIDATVPLSLLEAYVRNGSGPEERAAPDSTGSGFSFLSDGVAAGAALTVRLKICLQNCQTGDAVSATLDATVGDQVLTAGPKAVPADAAEPEKCKCDT